MGFSIDYFLLCENAITDEVGRASVINIYDTIFAENVPAFHSALHLVARILTDDKIEKPHKTSFRASIKSPSGKEKLPKDANQFSIEFTEDKPHMIVNIKVPGVVFDEFGIYKASLLLNNKTVVEREFTVKEGGLEDVEKIHKAKN